jgi:NAD(P)-dependent dehydrogenase (short-subunit alcohol dehydrogenase family)
MISFKNKHFIVFGGTSGIGRAAAIKLSGLGASLTIIGRNQENIDSTFDLLQTDKLSFQKHQKINFDLSNLDSLSTLVSAFDCIDGIVYAAGIIYIEPIQYIDIDKFFELQKINSVAVIFIIKECLLQKKLKKNSSIVLIGSISGTRIGYVGSVSYSFSKGALSGMVKSLALELAKFKIRINSILPAMVKNTRLGINETFSEGQIIEDRKKYPMGDYLEVDDVTGSIIYLLSDSSKMVTGSELIIDGGYTLN